MATIRISEAEVARDFAGPLASVCAGAEVAIESGFDGCRAGSEPGGSWYDSV